MGKLVGSFLLWPPFPPVFALQKQSPIFDWGTKGWENLSGDKKGWLIFCKAKNIQVCTPLCFYKAKQRVQTKAKKRRPPPQSLIGDKDGEPASANTPPASSPLLPRPLHRRWREGPKIVSAEPPPSFSPPIFDWGRQSRKRWREKDGGQSLLLTPLGESPSFSPIFDWGSERRRKSRRRGKK